MHAIPPDQSLRPKHRPKIRDPLHWQQRKSEIRHNRKDLPLKISLLQKEKQRRLHLWNNESYQLHDRKNKRIVRLISKHDERPLWINIPSHSKKRLSLKNRRNLWRSNVLRKSKVLHQIFNRKKDQQKHSSLRWSRNTKRHLLCQISLRPQNNHKMGWGVSLNGEKTWNGDQKHQQIVQRSRRNTRSSLCSGEKWLVQENKIKSRHFWRKSKVH